MRLRPSAAALVVLAGCGGAGGSLEPSRLPASLHAPDLFADADPTVRPARLLPVEIPEKSRWGDATGGATRAIVAGVRVVEGAGGTLVAADDRLPPGIGAPVALPERMGGGFLFNAGTQLWRADSWLGRARPFYRSTVTISNVMVGLDRIYVRTLPGAVAAIDPRTGAPSDLGPLPSSPALYTIRALDGWRALAVSDLRGAEITVDAGSTWRPVRLPIEPRQVDVSADAYVVAGADDSGTTQAWEVRSAGQVGRLPARGSREAEDAAPAASLDPVARVFGERPLVAAVEDGWPLRDGTALVARDGDLGRVRLSDGALVETGADAFPLRPARCHPVSLASAADPGAFGFVCGEPRGRTLVLRWDAPNARLVELRRFDGPREVVASGNGALAVRGPCAPESPGDLTAVDVAYCVMGPGQLWREIHFRGDDVDRARVVVLADGRVALVRPPGDGDLSTARLTLTDGARSTHLPLQVPEMRNEVAQPLRSGVWLDGFEERRPGVLGGWVQGASATIGIEIDLDGKVEVGEYVSGAGPPFVSGRWGFGWNAARGGFETTDGGMTWRKQIEMPDVLAGPRRVTERACGPVGCLVAGWIRIGWGAAEAAPPIPELGLPSRPASRDMRPLDLACTPTAGPAPAPATAAPKPPRPPRPSLGLPPLRSWSGPTSATVACAADLGYFQGHAPPSLSAGECGVRVEVAPNNVNPASLMIQAWGDRGGDWDTGGKWRVQWLWPWGGWQDARASATLASPWSGRDAAARYLGVAPGTGASWNVVPGDDADHALAWSTRTQLPRGFEVMTLETDRAPMLVRRPGGEPFTEILGATRAAGRWYLATRQSASERTATVVWALDGDGAREIARLPRLNGVTHGATRLARRGDGSAIGVVVDAPRGSDAFQPPRWIAAIDLESGVVSAPEALAPVDLTDPATALCTGDDPGWSLDLPYTSVARIQVAPTFKASLAPGLVRVHVSRAAACLERVGGSISSDSHSVEVLSTPVPTRTDTRGVEAGVMVSGIRHALRCTLTR